ncbi:hypothetical protein TWF506_008469 [Arthrobotrys conoides]|uniref:F-box domain-containing protein n=1 Tax=Arthrobotrys conoides TaxID=74498 RepID=A0AAN8NJ41_9PEZI
MASLTTLPAELLAQILSDPTLTSHDISNCSLISRRLYHFTADRKTKYSFHIDHRSQSTWNLITCILANPRIGARIRRIIVTWCRRDPHRPKSWTPQWLWKSQELEQIKSICEKYGVEFLYPVIEDGFNSEALLPFLLCLTPNLESLDMGRISPSMMKFGYSAETAVRVFKACERRFMAQNYKVRHNKDQMVYFDSRWGSSYRQNIMWTYSALNQQPIRLPGLLNLKHFRHGPSEPRRRDCKGWPAEYIGKVLLLPNIETATFYGAAAFDPTKGGNQYKPLAATPEFTSGKKSSVKQLEILNCDLECYDYSTLAEITGCLEVLRGVTPVPYWWRMEDRRASHMIDAFKKSNPKTLSANNISVKRATYCDMMFITASDVYFPFWTKDQEEDSEDRVKKSKDEEEGREYMESLIWKDEEEEEEEEEEKEATPEPSPESLYVCDHISECGCDEYFFDTGSVYEYTDYYGDAYDNYKWFWPDPEGDEDVVLRTRDVKGSKKRSHFVSLT